MSLTKSRTNSFAIAVVCLLIASPTAIACSSGIPISIRSRPARSSVGEGTSQSRSPIGFSNPIRSALTISFRSGGSPKSSSDPVAVDHLGLLAAEGLEDRALKLERLAAAAAGAHVE